MSGITCRIAVAMCGRQPISSHQPVSGNHSLSGEYVRLAGCEHLVSLPGCLTTVDRAKSADSPARPSEISNQSQIVIIVGSNRTGTSLLTEVLSEQGFAVPGETAKSSDYDKYENADFKHLSRHWDGRKAREFVAGLPGGKVVLKYPKASYVLRRWLRLMPHARVVYVFRPREEAVASNIRYSWRIRSLEFLAKWIYRWQWYRGYHAVSNLPVPVAFVTFEELKRTRRFDIPQSFGWG